MVEDDDEEEPAPRGMSKTGGLGGINRIAPRSVEEASTPEPLESEDGDEGDDDRDDDD